MEGTKKIYGLHGDGVSIITASPNIMGKRDEDDPSPSTLHLQAAKYPRSSKLTNALVLEALIATKSIADLAAVQIAEKNRLCLEEFGFADIHTVPGMPFATITLKDIPPYCVWMAMKDNGILTTFVHYSGDLAQAVRISLSSDPVDFRRAMEHLGSRLPEIHSQCSRMREDWLWRWRESNNLRSG